MDNIADTWSQFKADQPELALVLSVLPVTGQMAAATEYYDAIRKGDTTGAVMAATSFLPGGALIKEGKAGLGLAKTYQNMSRMSRSADFAAQAATKARGQAIEGAATLGAGYAGRAAGAGLDSMSYVSSKLKPAGTP